MRKRKTIVELILCEGSVGITAVRLITLLVYIIFRICA